jgi:hypothetical protein
MANKELNAADIAAAIARDFKVVTLNIPAWGGDVNLRTMTAEQRDAYSASIRVDPEDKPNMANFRARLVARCLCDRDGKRLYDDPEKAAKEIGAGSSPTIELMFDAARKLNGLTDDDIDELVKK